MYFNENVDTNIDSQFNSKGSDSSFKNFFSKNKKLILIIGGVLLLVALIIILVLVLSSNVKIELYGDKKMILYQGDQYVEPGYVVKNKSGEEVNKKVKEKNNVNFLAVGNYKITYSVGLSRTYRYVEVVDKPIGATYIHLNGSGEIHIKVGENYKEPGYIVMDTVDNNLNGKVMVTNNIDNTKPGIYQVTYYVINSSGITTTNTRKVIVE